MQKHVFDVDLNVGKKSHLPLAYLMTSDNKLQASTKAVNCTVPIEKNKKGLNGSTQGYFTLDSLEPTTGQTLC